MVLKEEYTPGRWRFVLRPNRSATWPEVKRFFWLVAAVSLSVAIFFSAQGFWPVLPFAGAELAFLWFCLHHNVTRGRDTEVVDIDEHTVAVERGRSAPEHRWSFERAWTRIRLEPAEVRLHPCRLLLGSHGRTVRLGRFLSEDELVGLANDLEHTLAGRLSPSNPQLLLTTQSPQR